MRLLLTLGYQKILFGKGAPVAELILAVDGAALVTQDGYGANKRFIPEKDSNIQVELVNEDSCALPEADSTVFDKFHEVAKQRDEAMAKVRELEKQLKAVRGAVEPAAAKEPDVTF